MSSVIGQAPIAHAIAYGNSRCGQVRDGVLTSPRRHPGCCTTRLQTLLYRPAGNRICAWFLPACGWAKLSFCVCVSRYPVAGCVLALLRVVYCPTRAPWDGGAPASPWKPQYECRVGVLSVPCFPSPGTKRSIMVGRARRRFADTNTLTRCKNKGCEMGVGD